MPDIRNYNNPWKPRFSEQNQAAQLTGESYIENKTGKVIDALIRSIRKGTIVEVVEIGLLAPVNSSPAKRRKIMAERVEEIKERGGIILEKATGHRSDKGQLPRMMIRGSEFIASSGRVKNKCGRAGQPAITTTPHEDDIIDGIWHSRHYKNDKERLVAIEKRTGRKFKRTWLWNKCGSPSGQKTTDTK